MTSFSSTHILLFVFPRQATIVMDGEVVVGIFCGFLEGLSSRPTPHICYSLYTFRPMSKELKLLLTVIQSVQHFINQSTR